MDPGAITKDSSAEIASEVWDAPQQPAAGTEKSQAVSSATTTSSTNIDGLKDSPLRKLPGELRNTIYEMVLASPGGFVYLGGPKLSGKQVRFRTDVFSSTRAIRNHEHFALTATCKQIRNESRSVFFESNDFHVFYYSHNVSVLVERMRQSVKALKKRPVLRHSSFSRIILEPQSCLIYTSGHKGSGRSGSELASHAGDAAWQRTDKLGNHFSKYQKDTSPSKLFVKLEYRTHRFANEGHICRKPDITGDDCGYLEYLIPFGSLSAALAVAEEIYDKRRAKLEAHQGHRVCMVRLELKNMLRGLDESIADVRAKIRLMHKKQVFKKETGWVEEDIEV